MREKGFTLVELLAVIIILAIIVVITLFSVKSTLSDSKESLSETQIKRIEEAAEVYYLKEGMNENETCVSVSELVNKGYIEGDSVKDPKTKENIRGYVRIDSVSNKYSYEYQTDSCKICKLTGDANNNKEVDIGDEISCEFDIDGTVISEKFYLVPNDSEAHSTVTEEDITLLTKYNIRTNGQTVTQETIETFTTVFSETNYWDSTLDNGKFIYNENSSLYPYVESYRLYLNNIGINIKESSLMSYNQSLGTMVENQLPEWMTLTSFWLGSKSNPLVGGVWCVDDGTLASRVLYSENTSFGIRPVIIISEYEI